MMTTHTVHFSARQSIPQRDELWGLLLGSEVLFGAQMDFEIVGSNL